MKLQPLPPFEGLDFPGRTDRTVVIFHGYGADCGDLAPFRQFVDPEGEARWVFPNGPLQIPIGPGFWGRAWMKIVERELADLEAGRTIDLSNHRPEGADKVLAQSLKFIKGLRVEPKDLILGGFSQGSMLALELALALEDQVKGLILLSGNAVDVEGVKSRAKQLKGLSFFQSHGRSDAILGFGGAQKLHQLLSELGATGDFLEFSGGHEIPMPILEKMKEFIQAKWIEGS